MKVKVAYTEGYAKGRFIVEGTIMEEEEILDVDVLELSAETREGLLEIVGLDPWKDKNLARPGSEVPNLDLEWAGPQGEREGQFLLDGPPGSPSEWDEVLGRFFEARQEYRRRLRESEDAEVQELIFRLREELSGGNQEGVAPEFDDILIRRRGRINKAWDPFLAPLNLCSYEHATPELLHEVEDLRGRVRSMRDERAAKADAERREQEAQQQREWEELRATEKNRRAKEKERQAEEKRAWIERHGSRHLIEAIAAGYDCRDLYVRERTALEWPGYEPHLDKHARWTRLSSPSPEAFAEAKRVGGRVAWLTSPASPFTPGGATNRNDWIPCEAVIVGGFLGRYFLVKEIR